MRDAATGAALARRPLLAPNWSGIAAVSNALVLGTGASQQGFSDGVPPSVPGRRR